jgi:hypothetical protein
MRVRWRRYAKDVILKRIASIEGFSEREEERQGP